MLSKKWIIALSVVGGVGVLVWLTKKSLAASLHAAAQAPAVAPSTTTAPATTAAPAQKLIDSYSGGKVIGQVMWTASDEQSKLVGPRYPDFYDADLDRFIFLNPTGSGYSWITIDLSTGMVVGNGSSTGNYQGA